MKRQSRDQEYKKQPEGEAVDATSAHAEGFCTCTAESIGKSATFSFLEQNHQDEKECGSKENEVEETGEHLF